jgi:hypothetical protein
LRRAARIDGGAPFDHASILSLSLSLSLHLSLSFLSHFLRQVGLLQVEPRGLVAEHADLVVEHARAAGNVLGRERRKLGREPVVDAGLAVVLRPTRSAAEDLGLHVRCGHGWLVIGVVAVIEEKKREGVFSSLSFFSKGSMDRATRCFFNAFSLSCSRVRAPLLLFCLCSATCARSLAAGHALSRKRESEGAEREEKRKRGERRKKETWWKSERVFPSFFSSTSPSSFGFSLPSTSSSSLFHLFSLPDSTRKESMNE